MTDLEIIKELEKEYSIKDFYELDKDGEITSLVWDFSFKKISETKLGLKMLKFFIGFNGNIDMYDFLFEKIHIKNITISRTPNHQNSITWNDISSFLNKFSILNSFNFIFTNTYDIPSYDVFKELARLNLRVFFGSNAETIHSLINEYNYSNEKSVSKIIRILKDQKIGTSVFRAKSPFRILLDFSDLISSNVYINNYDLIDRLNSKTGKP
ncbi:MAG: hypothetical protein U9Q83_01790, partial [Bacteroidota bacterium]|nr:hypothetical protein [Bacteroidota bacterium]